jgi:hypothetical protein
VTAVRISGFIDQISNAIGFNVTVLQAYSLAGIRTSTQRQVALLTWRCIVNEDRRSPRQHIVRVEFCNGEVVDLGLLRPVLDCRYPDLGASVGLETLAGYEVRGFDPLAQLR